MMKKYSKQVRRALSGILSLTMIVNPVFSTISVYASQDQDQIFADSEDTEILNLNYSPSCGESG